MVAVAAEGLLLDGERIAELDELVTFVGPENGHFTNLGVKLIDWRKEEIEAVKARLRKVWSQAPGLLELAAGVSGKLIIGRASKVIAGRERASVQATTDSATGSIVLTDLAFRDLALPLSAGLENRLYRLLVHELVHASDVGYRTAYSKAWVSFAQPTISILQKRLEGLSGVERYNVGSKLLRETDWPSVYGCENLQEALAEYFTFYYFETGLIRVQFVEEFAPHFVAPTEEDRLYVKHFRRGEHAYSERRWNDAISEFSTAHCIDPCAALPPVYLMWCYNSKRDEENALKYSAIALDCFELAGVPPTITYLVSTQCTRVGLLSKAGRNAEATALSQKVQGFKPLSESDMQQLEMELKEFRRNK